MLKHPTDTVDLKEDPAREVVRFVVTTASGKSQRRDVPFATLDLTELSDENVQVLMLIGWTKM